MSVNVDQIVVSDKFKHSDEGFKYFIGYQDNEIVKPLCIILPQMSWYIKFLGNEVPKEKMHYTCIACITIDWFYYENRKKISASLFRRVQI